MTRVRMLAALFVCIAMQPAVAESFHREDLRIPMEVAGPRGLEAMLLRPSGTRRYPLALISHGAPREAAARAPMSPYRTYRQALEFARRGFAALVFMRRGYGDSGGQYSESSGPCERRDYLRAARESARDLRAAIEAMRGRTDVSTDGMIAVGVSAGGYASLALAADPPPGLAAAINFAGGRGSRADNDVCDEDALVRAFAMLGKTSRIPTLWIYAHNDKFFRPELARRMHTAFTGAGGRAQFVDFPPHGEDGHSLFSRGIELWTPAVDNFLRDQNLGTRDVAAMPAPSTLQPAPQLRDKGRAGFADYLSASPHRAFAVSPKGAFAFRSGRRSAHEAAEAALAACAEYAPDCALFAVDDHLAETANAGPR
jgi:dienelactone hydrolase